MYTAMQVINRALDVLGIQYARKYSEPGYSLDEGKHTILFAEWNSRGHWDSEAKKWVDTNWTMPRLAAIAERAGFECEWEDEWTLCSDCGGAVRTTGDCYGWKRAYWPTDDGDIVCAECIDPAEYLEAIEGDPDLCNTFDHINPEDHGYVLAKGEMENGYYGGQNDSPQVVAQALRALGIGRFLFSLDAVGQFDARFSCWVHNSDLAELDQRRDEASKHGTELAGVESIASALPYDPATELGKALRGEHSNVYRMETREVAPEEFIRGIKR